MMKTYDKNTGDQSVRTEILYKVEFTEEELLQLAQILYSAFPASGSVYLLDDLVSQFPDLLSKFER